KMTGGNISGNSADSLGGGVYLDSDEGSRDGIFTLTGGNITGNKATSGGGIYVRYYDPTKYTDTIFKVSDNPVITGNTLLDETTSNNVYLPSNKTITVDTSLTTGAKIGVTTETEPTDTAPVAVTGENTADYTQYFTSDLSAYSVSLADSGNVVQLVPTADSITISLEETTTTGVYDIVLTAPSGTQIDKFLSAQLKFVLNSNQTDSTACDITKIDALTVTANTDDYIGLINYGSGVYEFNMDGTNASSLTGSEITLGTVTINGLGYYSLGLDTSYDNVINCDSGSGVRVEFSETEGNLTLSTVMPVENEIKPELVPLTINVKFPNRVYSQTAAYTDMAVEVNNNIDERYLADETIALGSNGSSTKTGTTVTYVTPNTPDYDYYGYVIETEVAAGYSATLTFTGSGYRTCSATVLPESGVAAATVNVWNNPMDNSIPVVYYDGTADTSSKTDIIFLAGDIENDKSINLYDLSAVTSFFGYEAKDLTSKPTNTYLGKDLNRDGKIDSRDIALVLVAWGK
ncbi:MAG: dockerin type I domain-containing protein, partial [Oscillospiraceae bacterium]|nr:dockerin type I domain-containing protein [Oscillospiraceae bacterium]